MVNGTLNKEEFTEEYLKNPYSNKKYKRNSLYKIYDDVLKRAKWVDEEAVFHPENYTEMTIDEALKKYGDENDEILWPHIKVDKETVVIVGKL